MPDGRRFSLDLPPIWLLAFAGLSWGLSVWLPILRFDAGPVGRVLIGAGILLILWSAWYFWRKSTPIEPRHTPKALIVEGPYRLSRNPIYAGLALILAGLALGFGALSALIPVLGFPPLITRRFILAEEAALRAQFGAEAEVWLAQTRRWIL